MGKKEQPTLQPQPIPTGIILGFNGESSLENIKVNVTIM